ncbi:hypothetical protein Deipe_2218 [Deinococcus peraridilitoris DSM 19664]|uniref:Uncharacterized protein n=1 Tax=Deinococcus peraridilitoris (strain DSM 19664 / LMG 22246 / CIP 109416 / KR-200) TaxID=937777 RepID=L0A1D4_DEIPD|nr:hypothetical protein Deipe_2218 [Deinococcus peraridilitoris DSM 19664]
MNPSFLFERQTIRASPDYSGETGRKKIEQSLTIVVSSLLLGVVLQ